VKNLCSGTTLSYFRKDQSSSIVIQCGNSVHFSLWSCNVEIRQIVKDFWSEKRVVFTGITWDGMWAKLDWRDETYNSWRIHSFLTFKADAKRRKRSFYLRLHQNGMEHGSWQFKTIAFLQYLWLNIESSLRHRIKDMLIIASYRSRIDAAL